MPISSSAIGLLLAFAAQAEAPPAPPPEMRSEKFDDWSGTSSPGRYSTAATRNEAEQNFNVICDDTQCRAIFVLLTSCSENFVYRVRVEATPGTFDDELICNISPAGNFVLSSEKVETYRKAIAKGGELAISYEMHGGEKHTARFSLNGGAAATA